MATDGSISLFRNSGGPGNEGAVVREVNGQLVLDDPVAAALVRGVEKRNCRNTFRLNVDRIEHFKRRMMELALTPAQAVIVILNVDDFHGGPLAEVLMPGYNWQEMRDRGEVPFARGIAGRDGIQEALGLFDNEAATKLRGVSEVAVVVVDHGVAEVFAVY